MIYLVFDARSRVYRFAWGRSAATGTYASLGTVTGYVHKSDAILHASAYGLHVDKAGRVYPVGRAAMVH